MFTNKVPIRKVKMKTRKISWLASAALGASLAVLGAGTAHATTADCRSELGNQCGTFAGQDAAGHTVYWDDKGQVRASDAVIIGYTADSTGDPATDFTKVEHVGKVPGMGLSNQDTISWSFVYTPRGSWSSLCIADPGSNGNRLVLRTCNGLQWQRFVAQDASAGTPATPVNPTVTPFFNGDHVTNGGTSVSPGSTHAFLNAATRKYVTDTSTGAAGTPDPRQLVDTAPDGTVTGQFGANQVWAWAA